MHTGVLDHSTKRRNDELEASPPFMGAQWYLGPSPKSLDPPTIEIVKQLFLDQTGEVYSAASVKSLPIPEWGGNLVLLDDNQMLRGLLWTNKFSETRVRIVAFAIDSEHKGMGFGTQAWEHLVVAARADGIKEIQLEVRGDNEFAIEFYRRRGLELVMPLEGYYKAGIGYVMRGNI